MNNFIKHSFLILLFVIGIIGQLAVISPSGTLRNGDLLFWSAHGHDAMWHIAVSNEIKQGFPFQNPVLAGEKLVNYHLFSDILPAYLNKFLKFPSLTLYFWIMPLVYSFLLGLAAYLAGKEIGKSRISGLFSVLAVYFIGSFGYIVTLLQGRGIGGESLFWATQVQSSIGNPPQILSDIFFLATIYCLAKYLKGNLHSTIPLILLLTFTSIAKVYAGMVILPAFALLATYRLISHKKIDLLVVATISSLVSLGIYLPFSKGAGQYLILEPLWYARKIFSDTGRVGIQNFELITQHYQNLHSLKAKIGFARYDILGVLLIIFGNLGTRSLGFLAVPKFMRKNTQMGLFLLSCAILSLLIPILFLQKGVATNTSQTLQYMLLILSLFFALMSSEIFSKTKNINLKIVMFTSIILLSIPTQIGLLYELYSRPAYAKIERSEIEALNYLKNNSDKGAIIITPPYDSYLDTKDVPPPIWDWFDTSYVAAMSERSVYFADYEQVDIMGYDYKQRVINQNLIFKETNNNQILNTLRSEKITFVYFPKTLKPKVDLSKVGLIKYFENDKVEIWEVI